jgi:hypothetical protein
MRRILLPFLISSTLLLANSSVTHADALSELASFSVFNNVNLNDLANGDVKTAHGPPMSGRFLSVETVYLVQRTPTKELDAQQAWNPTRHPELKVFLHSDLPASPAPANFSKLQKAPDNSSVHAFVNATEKLSSDLQLSKQEAKQFSGGTSGNDKMPAAVVKFWSNVLAARAKNFAAGGTAAEPPYNHGSSTIRPNEELNSVLKNQSKIRKQFSGFLARTGIGRGAGSLTPELYWELLDVDDQGVVTLGASYSHAGPNGTEQAADVLYYASGGYYVALTLCQLWPVTVNGKQCTLVWRGDMTSAASLADLHGIERLGSESAMMKNVSRAVAAFRHDTGGR